MIAVEKKGSTRFAFIIVSWVRRAHRQGNTRSRMPTATITSRRVAMPKAASRSGTPRSYQNEPDDLCTGRLGRFTSLIAPLHRIKRKWTLEYVSIRVKNAGEIC
jgi:hypothetical protein